MGYVLPLRLRFFRQLYRLVASSSGAKSSTLMLRRRLVSADQNVGLILID
jgi:hypothetical protein